jgi:CRISPR system Cascade subunit CasE
MSGPQPLHLIQIRVLPAQLIRFAQRIGVNKSAGRLDEDLGYTCHAWLKALLGERAPLPFRLHDAPAGDGARLGGRRSCRLLGYGASSQAELREQVGLFADPDAAAALDEGLDGILARTLPTEWRVGQRLGFEVLACPVTRKAGSEGKEQEMDVFLRRCALVEKGVSVDREAVYKQWLATQLAGAELTRCEIGAFRRIHLYRRVAPSGEGGHRRPRGIERPQALLQGELGILDPSAFTRCLARGIGRHRAFGFGMLLLRPPG